MTLHCLVRSHCDGNSSHYSRSHDNADQNGLSRKELEGIEFQRAVGKLICAIVPYQVTDIVVSHGG